MNAWLVTAHAVDKSGQRVAGPHDEVVNARTFSVFAACNNASDVRMVYEKLRNPPNGLESRGYAVLTLGARRVRVYRVIVLGLFLNHFRNILGSLFGARPICEFCSARAEDAELFRFTGRGGLVSGNWLCSPCNESPPWTWSGSL